MKSCHFWFIKVIAPIVWCILLATSLSREYSLKGYSWPPYLFIYFDYPRSPEWQSVGRATGTWTTSPSSSSRCWTSTPSATTSFETWRATCRRQRRQRRRRRRRRWLRRWLRRQTAQGLLRIRRYRRRWTPWVLWMLPMSGTSVSVSVIRLGLTVLCRYNCNYWIGQ